MRSTKYGLGLAIVAACMAFGAVPASADRVEVLPGDINAPGGEWSSADTRPGGTAVFGTGPAIPTLGTGSVQLATPTSAAKVQIFTNRFDGVRLDAVDGLGFSTYRYPPTTGTSEVAQAAINIRVDRDGAGGPDAYLVYEPYQQPGLGASVPGNVWNDWDAYKGGQGLWWLNTGTGATPACNQAVPCAWDTIVATLPDAEIAEGLNCGPGNVTAPCPGSFGFNQGSGNEGALSNADALYISVNGSQTTFDFESEPGPTGPPGLQGNPGNPGGQGPAGATGPQGAAGTQGTFTPASTTTSKVALISRSLKVAKKSRKVTVSVRCPRANGLCEGRLSLVLKGKTIARTAFQVRGGRTGKVVTKLSKKRYKALKKSQRLKVNVFSRDLAGNASSASKTLTLKK